jgi:hypothetical protein
MSQLEPDIKEQIWMYVDGLLNQSTSGSVTCFSGHTGRGAKNNSPNSTFLKTPVFHIFIPPLKLVLTFYRLLYKKHGLLVSFSSFPDQGIHSVKKIAKLNLAG